MSIMDLTFRLLGEDTSASKSMSALQRVTEGVTSKIGGTFSHLGGVIGGEFGNILTETGDGIEKIGEHVKSVSAVTGVVGGVMTTAGMGLSAFASADEQAQARLKAAVSSTGQSYSKYSEDIEKAIHTNENYNFSAKDTQDALARMTSALGSPKKALDNLNVVANLAAQRHIRLADAADQVDRIMAGSGSRTLTQFGIHMSTTGNKTANAQAALEELSKKLDGQAKASVSGFGGQVSVLKTKITDWGAEMAGHVGPVLTTLGPILMGAAAAMDIFKAAQLGSKIASLAGAAATGIATAAQWAWNAAMDANPIMLIVLAIAALVAGLIWFFTQTKLGKEIWSDTMKVIGAVFNWLWQSVLHPAILAIGVAFTWLWNSVIRPVGQFIGSAVNAVGLAFRTVFGAIGNVIRGAFNGVVDFVRGIFNGVIDIINGVIGSINTVLSAGKAIGINVHLGLLPHFAGGGDMPSSGLAVVGENGPEVVRLPGGSHVFPNGTGPGSNGVTVNVAVNAGAVGNESFLAQTVTNAIINALRSGQINQAQFRAALGM